MKMNELSEKVDEVCCDRMPIMSKSFEETTNNDDCG
jgi:hypothetical protein